jgi:dihydropteroate synthase
MAGTRVAIDRPLVVAVLNVTPDSFSDGGRYDDVASAMRRVEEIVAEGADMLDIGGESTRPGATRIDDALELARVLPVVRAVRRGFSDLPISVDTTRSTVARAALQEGANVVNDVSGLRLDTGMAAVLAATGAGVVLMHSRGTVEDMASFMHASYGDDVVSEVIAELEESVSRAIAAGVRADGIVLDPGIGFSKRSEHSVAVLRGLDRLAALGFPVMVGASRKRVIGQIAGGTTPALRLYGTIGAHVAALARGARLFRVHDVRAHREALDAAWAVLS